MPDPFSRPPLTPAEADAEIKRLRPELARQYREARARLNRDLGRAPGPAAVTEDDTDAGEAEALGLDWQNMILSREEWEGYDEAASWRADAWLFGLVAVAAWCAACAPMGSDPGNLFISGILGLGGFWAAGVAIRAWRKWRELR